MDMMEMMKYLPPDDQARLLKLEDTFSSPGWKVLVEWATDARDAAILNGARATSWDDNRITLGRSYVYEEVISMAERIFTEYANYAEQAKLDAAVVDSEDFE